MRLTESKYQAKVIKAYESAGWYVLKLEKTNKNGIHDLLCLKEGQPPTFIEVKGERTPWTELQKFRGEEVSRKGFRSFLTRSGDDFLVDNSDLKTEKEQETKNKNDVHLRHIKNPFEL